MTLTNQPYVCLTPYEETLLSRGCCLADIQYRKEHEGVHTTALDCDCPRTVLRSVSTKEW